MSNIECRTEAPNYEKGGSESICGGEGLKKGANIAHVPMSSEFADPRAILADSPPRANRFYSSTEVGRDPLRTQAVLIVLQEERQSGGRSVVVPYRVRGGQGKPKQSDQNIPLTR